MRISLVILLASILLSCGIVPDDLRVDDNLYFKQISLEDGSLNEWDTFDSADMQFILIGESETYRSLIMQNVLKFPVEWDVPDSLRASDYRWTLKVHDIDNPGFEEVLSLSFNPFLKWDERNGKSDELKFFRAEWEIKIQVEYVK